jgi:hypothetical protein
MQSTHENLLSRVAGQDRRGALEWLASQLLWEDRLAELEHDLGLAA